MSCIEIFERNEFKGLLSLSLSFLILYYYIRQLCSVESFIARHGNVARKNGRYDSKSYYNPANWTPTPSRTGKKMGRMLANLGLSDTRYPIPPRFKPDYNSTDEMLSRVGWWPLYGDLLWCGKLHSLCFSPHKNRASHPPFQTVPQ